MSRIRTIALGAALAIVAMVAGMMLARTLAPGSGDSQGLQLSSGTVLAPPRPLPAMQFVDHRGEVFDNARMQGRWSLLFFGFTHCPDVCPMTLGVLAQVEKGLAALPPAERPHVVLISVDPERDSPQQLAQYVAHFSPSFVGATAPRASIDEFTRSIGVPVAITPTGEGGYTVDHSAAVFVINPDGALRALFSPPLAPATLEADLRQLIEADRR
jgi:protein SCO1